VRDLRTHFFLDEGVAKAVDGVSFDIRRSRTLGLVGESGCGKSVTALSILRLVQSPPGKIVGGAVEFEGKDLLKVSEREMRRIRGNDVAMIFQEPMTSLNPVFTVGDQIMEALVLHQKLSHGDARERTLAMLREVGIPSPEVRIDEYPHQMSGGMKQRVMIAMALACDPALLIADEPTTALDVTIQAQILRLLKRLQHDHRMAVLLITHDLGVIAENADAVAVMYASKIVEEAVTVELFATPLHPYTVGLFRSIPKLGRETEKLAVIPGNVPNPLEFPAGCKFHPRCFLAEERCETEEPVLRELRPGHTSACHFAEKLLEGAPATTRTTQETA
ncbi:MAG TPA: ABC transporter ATP-binding protein, partial [Planctomycetota bacterium]|nr:ABC transporter ATP-binding protein [Planctomycetota bacterium]